METICANITNPPVRVVAHQRYQFTTDDEIAGECDMEENVQASIASFPDSLLCNHYIGRNHHNEDPKRYRNWTRSMFQYHEIAILATRSLSTSRSNICKLGKLTRSDVNHLQDYYNSSLSIINFDTRVKSSRFTQLGETGTPFRFRASCPLVFLSDVPRRNHTVLLLRRSWKSTDAQVMGTSCMGF